jgi:hypothetical protein
MRVRALAFIAAIESVASVIRNGAPHAMIEPAAKNRTPDQGSVLGLSLPYERPQATSFGAQPRCCINELNLARRRYTLLFGILRRQSP